MDFPELVMNALNEVDYFLQVLCFAIKYMVVNNIASNNRENILNFIAGKDYRCYNDIKFQSSIFEG